MFLRILQLIELRNLYNYIHREKILNRSGLIISLILLLGNCHLQNGWIRKDLKRIRRVNSGNRLSLLEMILILMGLQILGRKYIGLGRSLKKRAQIL
jgi:hypothetical protein